MLESLYQPSVWPGARRPEKSRRLTPNLRSSMQKYAGYIRPFESWKDTNSSVPFMNSTKPGKTSKNEHLYPAPVKTCWSDRFPNMPIWYTFICQIFFRAKCFSTLNVSQVLTKASPMDYSQFIAGRGWKGSPQILAIVQTALVPYRQELFPRKCEELFWQLCEILTAILRKYHAGNLLPRTDEAKTDQIEWEVGR